MKKESQDRVKWIEEWAFFYGQKHTLNDKSYIKLYKDT